jgi:hypothetical protein
MADVAALQAALPSVKAPAKIRRIGSKIPNSFGSILVMFVISGRNLS